MKKSMFAVILIAIALVFVAIPAPAEANADDLVPLRATAEALGAQVDWDEVLGIAVVRIHGKEYQFQPTNGVMQAPIMLIEGRTYVPKYLLESL